MEREFGNKIHVGKGEKWNERIWETPKVGNIVKDDENWKAISGI
jgi:hypothetical protein